MKSKTLSKPIISGIQQIGIGVRDAEAAWKWYRKYFNIDVPIFKDAASATLMTRYTADKVEQRYAILAMNMQGGGGLEIWQYTSKEPSASHFDLKLGDLGIFAIKIRTRDVVETHSFFKNEGLTLLTEPTAGPDGKLTFFLVDPFGNHFQMVESESWFLNNGDRTGGVAGCLIGVTSIKKALPLYKELLGYEVEVYESTGIFADFSGVPGGRQKIKRLLLESSRNRVGAFGKLLCTTQIELVKIKQGVPNKIFEQRNWGDLGFIHLCFDIRGMQDLKCLCEEHGFPFTVDSSNSFDMGKAAGHFAYCEDPDGTLIEFVETHKIPVFEKLGIYLNLKNRKPEKSLPNWMLKLLSLNRNKN